MNSLKRHTLILCALYYLFIPLAIFLCSWVKLWIGIPLTIALGILPLYCTKNINEAVVPFTKRQLIISISVLLGWVVLSGIGGFVWQNPWDHSYRNAVFEDLFHKSWPVIEGDSILTYYLGYWLPSALAAKIADNIQVGWWCQLIYGFVGIWLAFRLTIDKVGNMKLRYLIPFIFFSGLDVVGMLIPYIPLRPDLHMELWSSLAFWESNTTLLFWVYNQAIPSWVGTMIILNFGRVRGIAILTLCILSISAPFSVVGLFPLCLYYILSDAFKAGSIRSGLNYLLSWLNIIPILGVIPVILYFCFNDCTLISIDFRNMSICGWSFNFLKILLLEILIFCIFTYRQIRRSPEFYFLLITSALCLIISMGDSVDFNSRVELPLNYYMTLQLIIYIGKWDKIAIKTRIWFICVSTLAVVTPIVEMGRTIYAVTHLPSHSFRAYKKDSIFKFDKLRENFVADSIHSRSNLPMGFSIFRYPDNMDKDK